MRIGYARLYQGIPGQQFKRQKVEGICVLQQQVGHGTDKIHYSLNLATQDAVLFNFCIPANGE